MPYHVTPAIRTCRSYASRIRVPDVCQYPEPTGGSVLAGCVVARAAAIPAKAATNIMGMKRVRKRFKGESCRAGAAVLTGVDLSDITRLAAEKLLLGDHSILSAGRPS